MIPCTKETFEAIALLVSPGPFPEMGRRDCFLSVKRMMVEQKGAANLPFEYLNMIASDPL